MGLAMCLCYLFCVRIDRGWVVGEAWVIRSRDIGSITVGIIRINESSRNVPMYLTKLPT